MCCRSSMFVSYFHILIPKAERKWILKYFEVGSVYHPNFGFHNDTLSDVTSLSSLSLLTFLPPPCYVVLPAPLRKLSLSLLQTGLIRARTCGQRGTSWPQRWLCLPQCPGRGRRWSMTSWAASPGEHPSWSASTSTSTWTGCSASSCCRVRKQAQQPRPFSCRRHGADLSLVYVRWGRTLLGKCTRTSILIINYSIKSITAWWYTLKTLKPNNLGLHFDFTYCYSHYFIGLHLDSGEYWTSCHVTAFRLK